MKRMFLVLGLMVFGAGVVDAGAQARPLPADSLQARLAALTRRLDLLEAGQCPPAAELIEPTEPAAADSLGRAIWRLELRLHRLTLQRCGAKPDTAAAAADDLAALRAAAAAATPVDTTSAGPVQFVGKQRSGSALNPEISATGDVRLVVRDPGPQRDNLQAREFEFAFQSALDPYSNTKVFLTFSEEEIGVEEGYIYWTGLPGKLRLDLGKIRQQVGDLNRWHLHALPETDYPLVYQRFLGEEGLSGVGVSLYTALPVSIAHGTHEVWGQATSAESEPLFGNSRQISLLGRIQNFWQLSRSTYMQLGITGVGGNNRDQDTRNRLVGADFRITWRPPSAATRREVTFRAEAYRLHTNVAGIKDNHDGAFADLQARVSRRLVLGSRFDKVSDDWQVVPALTWWQSEFVYLRLEGRHGRLGGENRSQLLAQVVWAMGPHKHETY